MARIGMQGMKYGILDESGTSPIYETAKEFAGAVSMELTVNKAEASLYADDRQAEYATAFQNATFTLTAADDKDDVFADLLGRTKETETGRWRLNINDKVPYAGFGYIVSKIVDGLIFWILVFLSCRVKKFLSIKA